MSLPSLSPSTSDSVVMDPQPLRSYKRPYKKSLSGCKSCKARKIKCDEQRPVCGNCKKRYVDVTCCEYKTIVSKKSKDVESASSAALQSRMQRQVSFKPFEESESNRLLELRLLHHYTKSTCDRQTLSEMVPILSHPMWEVDIPQIAFSSPIVLDALLGVSALHLLALQPWDKTLALASRSYFNKSLTKQRESLPHVNAENAESLLVAAVLIAHQTWLSSHYTAEIADERYNLAMHTFQMCQGITALMRRASPWLEKYSWLSRDDQASSGCEAQSKGFMKHALNDLSSISVHFYRPSSTPEDSAAYESMAEKLVVNYSLLLANPQNVPRTEQSIVTVLHRVVTRFLDLLKEEDPVAMALMARNMVLLSFFEDSKSWWIHGGGQQKVPHKALFGIRKLMPMEWLWTLEWPMNIIAKEITLEMD